LIYLLFHHHALDDCGRKVGNPDLAADETISQPLGGRKIADRVRLAGFQFLPPFPRTGQGAQDVGGCWRSNRSAVI